MKGRDLFLAVFVAELRERDAALPKLGDENIAAAANVAAQMVERVMAFEDCEPFPARSDGIRYLRAVLE